VLLETTGIFWILSTPCIGPYPVSNVYKNGTIRIQKAKKNCIRKVGYFEIHVIQSKSKAQLSIILEANDIP
jgi:hypothetical protein